MLARRELAAMAEELIDKVASSLGNTGERLHIALDMLRELGKPEHLRTITCKPRTPNTPLDSAVAARLLSRCVPDIAPCPLCGDNVRVHVTEQGAKTSEYAVCASGKCGYRLVATTDTGASNCTLASWYIITLHNLLSYQHDPIIPFWTRVP